MVNLLNNPSRQSASLPKASWVGRGIGAYVLAATASISGIKQFAPWEQVLILWDANVNLVALVGHPHFLRFLIAYPGLFAEEILPGFGFSLYISLYFALNQLLFRRIAVLSVGRHPQAAIQGLFWIVHLFMNGRGAIAWTGWLLCILVSIKLGRSNAALNSQLITIFISCWLSSVSTGVFIVTASAHVVSIWLRPKTGFGMSAVKMIAIWVASLPVFAFMVDFFLLAIDKNLEYYGGGLTGLQNMLEHGLGVVFRELSLETVGLSLLISIGILILLIRVTGRRPLSELERASLIAGVGGLFGFTVLTLAAPPILLQIGTTTRRSKPWKFPNIDPAGNRDSQ